MEVQKIKFPKYKVTIKSQQITKNTIVEPDGFGTFTLANLGTAPILLNDAITIPPSQRFDVPFEPYVQMDNELKIIFQNTGSLTQSAILVLLYYKEVDE